jgi:hypothetical protein
MSFNDLRLSDDLGNNFRPHPSDLRSSIFAALSQPVTSLPARRSGDQRRAA